MDSTEAHRNAGLEIASTALMVLSLAVFMGTARGTFGSAADTVVSECSQYGTDAYDDTNTTTACDGAYRTIDDESTYEAAVSSSKWCRLRVAARPETLFPPETQCGPSSRWASSGRHAPCSAA